MTPARLKELRAHAEAHRHFTRGMALELLGYVGELEARVEALLAFWGDVEGRSADAHAVYQKEAHRRGDVRHADAYEELPEATKEWDRVLVRWVAESLWAALAPEAKP